MLDACDRLGMLVLDEAFDCWDNGKNTSDYHVDLQGLVAARSLIPWSGGIAIIPPWYMWSIGNEIPDVFSAMGNAYSPQLAGEIHCAGQSRDR